MDIQWNTRNSRVRQKVQEIIRSLHNDKNTPEWLYEYPGTTELKRVEFEEWLRYVCLPNLMLSNSHFPEKQIRLLALQAKEFHHAEQQSDRLIRLLIELDALI